MSSEREHLEDVAQIPVRSHPNGENAAVAPGLLGSAIGNAAMTRLLRTPGATGAVLRRGLGSQGAGPLDPEIGAAIQARAGSGSPLPTPVRADMEQHFGYDLSPVRVHTDATSAGLNRAVQAEAFTTGSDIFFGGGAPDPASSSGRELLAHELTHVVQQSTGAAGSESRVSSPHDSSEVEARAVARQIVSRSPEPTEDFEQ